LSFDTAWIFSDNALIHSDFLKSMPKGINLVPVGDAINDVANRLSDEFINIDQKLLADMVAKAWNENTK